MMKIFEFDTKRDLICLAVSVLIVALIIACYGCESAQKRAQLKAGAAKAEANTVKPPKPEPPPYREGMQERIGPGFVTGFESAKSITATNVVFHTGFTFRESRGGFEKRFFPMCDGQAVPAGGLETLLYHWRAWSSYDEYTGTGCYSVDGVIYE